MTTRARFFGRCNLRRASMLRKMEAMRAAKERKRLERSATADPLAPPRCLLEIGVRDTSTGEVAWMPFVSVRQALRTLAIVKREYQPGLPHGRRSACQAPIDQ